MRSTTYSLVLHLRDAVGNGEHNRIALTDISLNRKLSFAQANTITECRYITLALGAHTNSEMVRTFATHANFVQTCRENY